MADTDRKRALRQEYKARKVVGGVFRVVNTQNGKYFLDYTPNLSAKENAFSFMSAQGSCFEYRLTHDWMECGPGAFKFEVLDKLEKKDTQTPEEFLCDLKALLQLWSEKLDPALRY